MVHRVGAAILDRFWYSASFRTRGNPLDLSAWISTERQSPGAPVNLGKNQDDSGPLRQPLMPAAEGVGYPPISKGMLLPPIYRTFSAVPFPLPEACENRKVASPLRRSYVVVCGIADG